MRRRDLIVLISAFLSFILSVYLWFSGEKEMGQYVSISDVNNTSKTGANNTQPIMNNCKSVIFLALY